MEKGPSAIRLGDEEQPAQLPSRRIHIMGMGSIGTFVAHSLMSLPNPPPISLLFHRPEMYDNFQASSRIIRLINKRTQTNDEQSGYDVDVAEYDIEKQTFHWRHISDQPQEKLPTNPPVPMEIMPSEEIKIYTLILAVKGPSTVMALRSVQHRISAETTICLMQNGMGQVEEINREVFTDPATRPTYMLGVLSHGVHLSRQFAAIHAGIGSTAIGIVRDMAKFPPPPNSSPPPFSDPNRKQQQHHYPTDSDLYRNITSRYLLRTLTRSPTLTCAAFPYLDLLQLQLEKLTVNCIVNPITALLNIPNGNMIGNASLSKVSRLLIAEISAVIRGLPELEGVPNVRVRFSPERLESLCVGVTRKTAQNSSSMREDIRNAKNTEIEYINGYIVRRGEEKGLKCVLNYMLMQLVKGKSWHVANAGGRAVPYGVSEVKEVRAGSGDVPEEKEVAVVELEDRGMPQRGEGAVIERLEGEGDADPLFKSVP